MSLAVLGALVLAATLLTVAVVRRGDDANPDAQPTSSVARADVRPRTLVLGGGDAAGAGLDDPDDRWSSVVAKQSGWLEINQGAAGRGVAPTTRGGGCDGSITCATYAKQLGSIVEQKPQVVVISVGRDAADLVDRSGRLTAMRSFLKALSLKLPDAEIIVVGPWSSDFPVGSDTRAFDQALSNVARNADITYCSLVAPSVLTERMVSADKRLTREGHQQVALRLLEILDD